MHTHLKSEPLTKDDLTDLALLRLDMVAAVGVGREGLPGVLHYAHLVPENGANEFWRVSTLPSVHTGQPDLVDTLEALEEELNRKAAARAVGGREMAILVAVCLDGNRGHAEASLFCAMAKRFATDQCFDLCNEALQLHGGYGYLNDYPLERWVRDTRVHQILEGTNEIMRVIVARRLLEQGGALDRLL